MYLKNNKLAVYTYGLGCFLLSLQKRTNKKNKLLLFLTLLLGTISFSQTNIKGVIVDQNSNTPLPFVNILYSSTNRLGTTSDLDGRFEIHSKSDILYLEFSFMGYKTKTISIDEKINTNKELRVKLEPLTYNLPSVDVYAKENPAHRIINKAIANRKKNKPESLQTYKYETYSKMFFTFDMFFYKDNDTISTEEYQFKDSLNSLDKNIKEINQFKKDQYLFLMESVTEKKYKKPGKEYEKVLASRVSGFENPAFTLLSTQLQSFTIYSDYITVVSSTYLSPLAKNSTKKYLFIIEDTLINSKNDTTYTLSYRPRKNKNFKGLEGILQINTNGYAVQSFSTKPTEQEGVSVIIRQKYEFVQDSAWFPIQLDADFTFLNIANFELSSSDEGPDKTYIYGKAKTYISNIVLNDEIKNKEFSHIAVDYEQEANNKDSLFWAKHRIDSISLKEINTYRTIDSLGKELNFEKKLKFLSYFAQGLIPMGPLSFHLDKLMNYNVAEGFRLGIGLSTNEKVFKNLTIGGYGAYAFGDYRWKYGGNLKINLRDQYDSHFNLSYKNDIAEVGGFKFLEASPFLNPETYRDYLINKITYEETVEAAFELRFAYYLKTRIYAKYSEITSSNRYYELNTEQDIIEQFKIPEVGLKLRFAYHEYYIRTPMGIQALKTKYPVLFFNISKSIAYEQYTLDYTKIWGKVEKRFKIRNLGSSYISLQGGYAFGDLPYFKLFNGHGSYYPFSIVALNSFGTMRMNEFISDQFVYFFYRHSFGKLLFKTKKFQPELSFVQNIGWGDLKDEEQQLGVATKTMNKGFFESGIIIDNILGSSLSSIGVGLYYRYGPYAFDEVSDNFAFKLSVKFNLSE